MVSERQATLARAVAVSGIGLHSGRLTKVELRPSFAGSGIRIGRSGDFHRIQPSMVERMPLCTRVWTSSGSFSTVEHLMAALAITGVDNVTIDIDGDEIPAMDGSSLPWAKLIYATGLRHLQEQRHRWKIRKPFEFEVDGSRYFASPGGDSISVTIEFPGTVIGTQTANVRWSNASCLLDARTFVFESDIAFIRNLGLARGGNLDNAIVVGPSGPLNVGGLRGNDEYARHKALDLIGDLYMCGRTITGGIQAIKPGHSGNNAFLIAMMANGVLEEAPEPVDTHSQWPWMQGLQDLAPRQTVSTGA